MQSNKVSPSPSGMRAEMDPLYQESRDTPDPPTPARNLTFDSAMAMFATGTTTSKDTTKAGAGSDVKVSGADAEAGGGSYRLIDLRSAVMDTFEYHGLAYLAYRFGFWVLLVAAFFSCYTRDQAVNASNMVTQMSAFGDSDWQQSAFVSQKSFPGAATYMFDWALALFRGSVGGDPSGAAAKATAAAGSVTLGDYSTLMYVRIVVDLETNCRYTSLPCAATDNVALFSPLWNRTAPNMPSYLYNTQRLFSALVYSKPVQNDSVEALARLSELSADLNATILPGGYAFKLALEVVCDFSISPGKFTWVALSVQRATPTPNVASLETAISTYVETMDLQGEQPIKPRCIVLISGVLLGTIAYLCVMLRSAWLYDLQRMHHWRGAQPGEGVPGNEPRRKASWAWCIATYFTYSLWNSLELISLTGCLVWCLVYMYGIYIMRSGIYYTHYEQLPLVLSSEHALHRLLMFGCLTGFWYELGSFAILLAGLCLYPYLRVHRGLRMYLHVLSAAWKAIVDFAVFFAYMFVLIGIFCLTTGQLYGIQPDMTYPSTALAALAKLALGFYGYEQFVNAAVPRTTAMVSLQDATFWISIIMLYIFVQNILLAVVAVAYDAANSREGPADASFPFTVLLRLLWYPIYGYYRLWRGLSVTQIVATLSGWPASTFTLYFSRWAVACSSEAQALQAYYTFFLNWQLEERSPWLHDPLAVQRSHSHRTPRGRTDVIPDVPPDSVAAPLTLEQLRAALAALEATPSFQRLVALRLPWPLHRVKMFRWQEGSAETLAELLWGTYSYKAVDSAAALAAAAEAMGEDGRARSSRAWASVLAAVLRGAAVTAPPPRRHWFRAARGAGGSNWGRGDWAEGDSMV